jgi:hypothetical protein
VSPISTLFSFGRSTPAIRAILQSTSILILAQSTLTLFMLRIFADNHYLAFALDNFALFAHFSDRRSDFHLNIPPKIIWNAM